MKWESDLVKAVKKEVEIQNKLMLEWATHTFKWRPYDWDSVCKRKEERCYP